MVTAKAKPGSKGANCTADIMHIFVIILLMLRYSKKKGGIKMASRMVPGNITKGLTHGQGISNLYERSGTRMAYL
jgi:hypothetical protein